MKQTTLTKRMEKQQKVAKAAEMLIKHFGEEYGMCDLYREMALAQSQVISLMQLAETSEDAEDEEILVPRHVALFFDSCCTVFRLLEPLDAIAKECK